MKTISQFRKEVKATWPHVTEKIKTPPVNVVQMPTLSPVAVKLCDWPIV